ncbi:hypothetical protein QW71_25900 [Paenibacillus sp. IHB B 3415]|uniref:DUF3169 family protein n=1 Tax=Paenibacillus sp. IHB B 3415 TaxID=867080 RepID=UPI0005754F9E|nr:DUF3169 family protein [Paenibacillus sp. IHB B 3415]KHL92993.1 hypothetical protein QW71_25900 [Paenibacillus sp. IHB B 3415]
MNKKIKKTKKRTNPRGLIMLIGSMTIGGAIGYVFASGMITVPKDFHLNPSIFYEYDVLFGSIALLSLLLTALTLYNLVKARRMKDEPKHDGEIENSKDKALSSVIQLSFYTMIISLLWTLMSLAHALGPGGKESSDSPFMLANMLTALVVMLFSFVLLHHSFKLYNNNYPDRQINISLGNSRDAQRELFAKMDEGEQWIVYRSSYSSFTVTSISLLIGMVFFTLYSLVFGFAPVPIMVLALILLIQQAVYYHQVHKYS